MAVVTLGINCKFYRGDAGAQASTLVPNLRDVTLTMEYEEVDASSRESGGWEETETTIRKAQLDAQVLWKKGDPHFEAFRDAYLNNEAIAVLPLDGLVADEGSQGLDCDVKVTKFDVKQPLKDVLVVDITMKPTPSTRAPAWFVVPEAP